MKSNELGSFLRECRIARGLNGGDIAKKIGRSASYLYKLELGQVAKVPSDDSLAALAGIYSIPFPPLKQIADRQRKKLKRKKKAIKENNAPANSNLSHPSLSPGEIALEFMIESPLSKAQSVHETGSTRTPEDRVSVSQGYMRELRAFLFIGAVLSFFNAVCLVTVVLKCF